MMDTVRFARYCMRQCNTLISEYEDFLELVRNLNAGGV